MIFFASSRVHQYFPFESERVALLSEQSTDTVDKIDYDPGALLAVFATLGPLLDQFGRIGTSRHVVVIVLEVGVDWKFSSYALVDDLDNGVTNSRRYPFADDYGRQNHQQYQ